MIVVPSYAMANLALLQTVDRRNIAHNKYIV